MEVPLKTVSFSGQDEKDKKIVGFISTDTGSQQLIVHMLKSNKNEVRQSHHH